MATVFIAIVSGNEFSDTMGMSVPAEIKFKAFLIVFIQPLAAAVAILFGAALLWRLDKFMARSPLKEAAE